MERSTKIIKTPSGFEVVMKDYITGGEARAISNVFLEAVEMKVSATGGENEISPIRADLANKSQDKVIEVLIISINGVKENIVNMFWDMPKEDCDFVLKELDEVQSGIKKN